jgi:ribosomal protein uL22
MEYSYSKKPQGRTARARLSRVNCSWKDLCEVCRNVRNKDTDGALEFLSEAAEGKQAVHFRRHAKSRGHRRELGGKPGGFPKKSARAVLSVLQSAAANAGRLGLGATKVAHIVSNKQAAYPRMSPKGRRIRHDYEVSFIEVVLEEIQQKAEKAKKAEGPKKAEAKKEAPKAEAKKEEPKKAEPVKKEEPTKAEAPEPAEKKEAAPKKPEAKMLPAGERLVGEPASAPLAPQRKSDKSPAEQAKKQDDIIIA